MKARKYENVEFVINHSTSEDVKMSLVWKKGGLYLSLSGLFLTDGATWYELPVKDLERISVLSDTPLKLRLQIPSLDIMISGQRAEKLLALRHFLLPYISGEGKEDVLCSLLKFWVIGIKDVDVLSKLLKLDEKKVKDLIAAAKEKGYMDKKGKVTKSGGEMVSDENNILLRREGEDEG
jgi:hypothetical protein